MNEQITFGRERAKILQNVSYCEYVIPRRQIRKF